MTYKKSVNKLPDDNTTWREWHVPVSYTEFSLGEILSSAEHMAAEQNDIPLMVQLIENPKFDIPGITLFNGSVGIDAHDCIHAILGRGMLPKDEAFIIGFTMGSTNRVSSTEEKLYTLAAKYLYPGPYKFKDDEIQVFKDAVRLGYISDCASLDVVDYNGYLDMNIEDARQALGVETSLLKAYYEIEARRYPDDIASQRLLK